VVPAENLLRRIQFEFDPIKLGQALAYLSTGIHDLTKLKAAKLLYFADKLHLTRYGRPITGDRYYCLDHGPIPSASLNAINDLLTPVRVRVGGRTLENQMSKVLGQFVQVDRQSTHPRLKSKMKPQEFDALTATEREVLDAIVKQYGKLPAGRLIELTHREKTWVASNKQRSAGSSVEIPWELFLDEGQPGLREHIDEHQETDAFLQAITRAARR
jgi:uncharacterized phage-associated protein